MWSGGMRAAPAGRPSLRRKLNVAQALGWGKVGGEGLINDWEEGLTGLG